MRKRLRDEAYSPDLIRDRMYNLFFDIFTDSFDIDDEDLKDGDVDSIYDIFELLYFEEGMVLSDIINEMLDDGEVVSILRKLGITKMDFINFMYEFWGELEDENLVSSSEYSGLGYEFESVYRGSGGSRRRHELARKNRWVQRTKVRHDVIPDDTFTKSADEIVDILLDVSGGDVGLAVKRINYYINRAGRKLSNRRSVLRAKRILMSMEEE